MADFIEHPDHTGASSNPRAPWNHPDAVVLVCNECDGEPPEYAEMHEGDSCVDEDCPGRYEEQ